ncbi:origin recognition complex subunit 2-like isoform X2 [Argiope bruennichi]|uniref:origin recognition complex subunit 2-like isoform X2 n=1 Tax=Argiope bruennichi TaxID=94029 RepID=UPI00249431F1|nr:origin recognition complex subunit 2-like isoform X2 [Argiope bruennichi]
MSKEDIIRAPMKPNTSLSEPCEEYQPSSGLFGEQDVEGKEIFKVTPLKHKSVKTSVESPSTGKLSEQLSKITFASPNAKISSPLPKESGVVADMSKRLLSLKNEFNGSQNKGSPDAQRPLSKRLRMKRELAKLKSSYIESDLEDSDEVPSSDDSENEEQKKFFSKTPKKNKSSSAATFSETYFSAQKEKGSSTSNRTLANLKLEKTNIDELQKILINIPDPHKKEKEALFKIYQSQFEKWTFLLHEGFNILLYGVGSKRNILNSFCKECLSDSLFVVVNGFFPSLTAKQVLSSITEGALEYDGKFSSNYEHTEYIKKHFSEGKDALYLIIHNLDGISLRNTKTQSLLSSLATVPNIHFLASIDHINAPLMWDQIMLNNFKWVWFDVTTFEPYILETSYENSIFKHKSSHLLLSSLLNVYNGLNSNGQGVFKILAQHQFEQKDQSFLGISFHEWYQECRDAFLVTSEVTMQAQLSEFKNHKLLSSRKSVEGCELWYIPVDAVTLEQFLESCK